MRYLFGGFVVSPAKRVLCAFGRELPLIPRYFDLLVLLLERRDQAVHRREILDRVWSDVVVSDGALSQAVRSLRRTLGDDRKEPVFIRTVQRHGYRFVFPDVVELPDDGPLPQAEAAPADPQDDPPGDPFEQALGVVLRQGLPRNADDEAERREAAETLHGLGTEEALLRLEGRPGQAAARALLRDARWDLAHAGAVPIFGRPGALRAIVLLSGLRLRRVVRVGGSRLVGAAVGGSAAGFAAGVLGGLVLRFGPGSTATSTVLTALPLFGAAIGGLGAAGVGAGLALAEALARSYRGLALFVCGALGGGLVGGMTHLFGLWTLEGLFGRSLAPVAGGFEGLVLGAAVGLGYALATPRPEGGMAAPRGAARIRAVAIAGAMGAVGAAILTARGSYLGAMSLDFMAHSFPGSQVALDPLARLLGEARPGLVTGVAIGAFEGFMFGAGVVAGLTRRPRV